MTNKFEGVDYLVGCYFHQDFSMYGENDKDVVDFFCNQSDLLLIKNVINSFYLFIKFFSKNKHDADKYFDEISCGYYYQDDGITGYEWAEKLKALLEKGLSNKK